MDKQRATKILEKMARERYCSIEKVLNEYNKYQKNGECIHFWPDENTACQMAINELGEVKYG